MKAGEALHDLERVRGEVELLEVRAAVEALNAREEASMDEEGAEVDKRGQAGHLHSIADRVGMPRVSSSSTTLPVCLSK